MSYLSQSVVRPMGADAPSLKTRGLFMVILNGENV